MTYLEKGVILGLAAIVVLALFLTGTVRAETVQACWYEPGSNVCEDEPITIEPITQAEAEELEENGPPTEGEESENQASNVGAGSSFDSSLPAQPAEGSSAPVRNAAQSTPHRMRKGTRHKHIRRHHGGQNKRRNRRGTHNL